MKDSHPPAAHHPLAYKNSEFIDSDDARPLRIMAEYLEPLHRFERQGVKGTIVFFGSARLDPKGSLGRYYEDARSLARMLTTWSNGLPADAGRYLVCSGGGRGIMEAANRGASEAGGRTVGLNISLPEEQHTNPYVTPDLSFEFRYFFMRKLWFAHLARAMVVFPGGFGTIDEMSEILTLAQTRKLDTSIMIILYGSTYWKEIINFDAMVRHGMISKEDMNLFQFADDPTVAMNLLRDGLTPEIQAKSARPAFAKSRHAGNGNWIYSRSGD
jgi:uncharacterized protein (TIGR00730 family)